VQTHEGTVTFKCEGCGVRKPEAEHTWPRSAFTVCSQACLGAAAQKKAQALHDESMEMLGLTPPSGAPQPSCLGPDTSV